MPQYRVNAEGASCRDGAESWEGEAEDSFDAVMLSGFAEDDVYDVEEID